MRKKILYVVDFNLDEFNSVRDIFYNVIRNVEMNDYEHVLLQKEVRYNEPCEIVFDFGCKTYKKIWASSKEIAFSRHLPFFRRVSFILTKLPFNVAYKFFGENFHKYVEKKTLKKIIRKEQPDTIINSTMNPSKIVADVCAKKKIPYFEIRYDTRITSPKVDQKQMYALEKHTMDLSFGYFIPSYFMDGYKKFYNSQNLIEYKVPLVINKADVKQAFVKAEEKHTFSYFGQLQSFRYPNRIHDIFKILNYRLHIFSPDKCSHSSFVPYARVTGTDLHQAIANSKFLIALDNGHPYEHYLPTKVCLYVSFTKPIIVFGDNKKSALRDFLKDYPNWYYQDINEPLDGLIEFIEKNDFVNELNEDTYSKYQDFCEDNGIPELTKRIKQAIG